MIDGTVMGIIVLTVAMVGTAFGLTQCASVIIEADGLFPKSPVWNEDVVQRIKNEKVLPKLWTPISEVFIGEAALIICLFFLPMDGDAQGALFVIIFFSNSIVLVLAHHLYRAGRPEGTHSAHSR